MPRRSSGPLFMPVNALTNNAYNGHQHRQPVGFGRGARLQRADLGNLPPMVRAWCAGSARAEKSSLVVFYKEYDTDPACRRR